MPIQIFDIDGTLTHAHGDIPDKTGLETYAFWPLLSKYFTQDVNQLNKMIHAWEESMKTELDPTGSSHKMMQVSLDTFRGGVTADTMRSYAKELTLKFIRCGVIRKEAVAYLERQAKQGITCVLSTGSYLDGALGFVDALVEAGLISKETQRSLHISGAIVDWEDYTLIHANVRERKLLGIGMAMGKTLEEVQPHVTAAFGDDPWINDKNILEIAPKGKGYVITTSKNKNKELPSGYSLTTWDSIISREAKHVEKPKEAEVTITPPLRSKL